MSDDAKSAWVRRVLGVQVPPVQPQADGEAPVPTQPQSSRERGEQAAREIAAGLGDMTMAFRKARLSWAAARSSARASIETLQAALREALQPDPDFSAMEAAIGDIGAALDGLDARLDDTLDAAMTATDRAKQAEYRAQALRIIDEYRTYVASNVILARVDTNPFMPMPVHALLTGELAAMGEELKG